MPVAAIIGGGVIGSGWAARFALHGWEVFFYDPDPESETRLRAVLGRARSTVPELYDQLPEEGTVTAVGSIAEAVGDAEWIQESTPERIDVKTAVIRTVQDVCREDAVLGSSTSGFTPSELQRGALRPGQIIVAHPYNPVYLLPIVELVGSPEVGDELPAKAQGLLGSLGMKPVLLRTQVPAHVGDRLLEALWREALWLIKDGVATTTDIDTIMTHGFGLRWAQMGLFETYRVAGGDAGMAHFLTQFGPCLKWPWSKLTDVPDLDETLIERIVAQSDEQSGGKSVRQLEAERDANLVALLKALRGTDAAAGSFLNRWRPRASRNE